MIFDSRSKPHGSASLDGSAIVPTRSKDWEPCKTCGERLEFATNGMGKLVPQCPVCDWGWKPSKDYAAYAVRMNIAQLLADDPTPRPRGVYNADRAIVRKCHCGKKFAPSESGQRHCSDTCKRKVYKERQRRQRQRWIDRGMCTLCGSNPAEVRYRTCQKCRLQRAKTPAAREALRRYWKAQGAA